MFEPLVYFSSSLYQYYLLDTSFLINFFDKRKAQNKAYLEIKKLLIAENSVACICGTILAEYASGQDKNLDALCFLESKREIYAIAGKLYKRLALKGEKIALNDCIIASYALFYNAVLVSCDKHFKRFKGSRLKLVE